MIINRLAFIDCPALIDRLRPRSGDASNGADDAAGNCAIVAADGVAKGCADAGADQYIQYFVRRGGGGTRGGQRDNE